MVMIHIPLINVQAVTEQEKTNKIISIPLFRAGFFYGLRIATHTCGMLAMTSQCHSERSEESVFPGMEAQNVLPFSVICGIMSAYAGKISIVERKMFFNRRSF